MTPTPAPTVVYLHGLASSPQSAKAVYFREKFLKAGWNFVSPDLNLPEFQTLTLSRGIQHALNEIALIPKNQKIVLMGSSFGGLTALHTCVRCDKKRIAGLILLASAFDFLKNKEMRPGDVEKWKAAKSVVICHNNLPLNFSIIEDLAQYNSYAVTLEVPTLVIHGRQDKTIGFEQSEEFHRVYPQTKLHLVNDGHDLVQSFPAIWGDNFNGIIPEFLNSLS